jgi:peptidoglycan/LPS O-acetylase OafA/YrhL/lysophospholipase L1-like esterase
MNRTDERNQTHSSRLSYLPGLDGLRALAVIAVLLYHADLPWIPGGFLGVEVFFVISGYLITTLLLVEWRAHGSIDLGRFWLRRARRLLPALFLVLAATLTFAVLFLPDEVAGLRSDALAATGYVTNWYLVISRQSYFEAVGRPSLLRHLWSLAIEAQFYLLWPLLFSIGMLRWRTRCIFVVVLAGAVLSAVLMAAQFDPNADPSRVYFGTDTRASGLLIGAALAYVWAPGRSGPRPTRLPLDLIGVGALGALVFLNLRLDEFQPLLYQGGIALVAICTAALIAVVVHPHAHLVSALLGWKPLRWVGLRSYGIYLWHWPIFMLTRPQLDVPIDGVRLLIFRLALTGLLTELSYRFVETPIRAGVVGRSWRALREAGDFRRRRLGVQWVGAIVGSSVSFLILAYSVVTAEPAPVPAYLSIEAIDGIVSPVAISIAVTPAGTPVALAATPAAATIASQRQLETQSVRTTLIPSVRAPAKSTRLVVLEPTAVIPITAVPTHEPDAQAVPIRRITVVPTRVTPTRTSLPATPSAANANDRNANNAISAQVAPLMAIAVTPQPATPTPTPTPLSAEDALLASQLTPVSDGAHNRAPSPDVRITALGDSVMLGAVGQLASALGNLDIDARVGRQASEAIGILRARRSNGLLGSVVIVHIGNNGILRADQLDEMMRVLADVRRVVLVNVRVPRRWEGPNNATIAEQVARYPNAVLVNWYAASVDRSEWLYQDGIHLRPAGAQVYAALIAAAVNASR